MAIIRWQAPGDVFGELDRLRQEVDRLFEGYSTGTEPLFSRAYPAVNITEDGDHFYVRGELPGVRPEDIEVSVVEGRLLISGERKLGAEEKGAYYHRREREGGTFRRTLALPAKVDGEKVSARVKNGVFVITLPKAQEVKPRKITVKT